MSFVADRQPSLFDAMGEVDGKTDEHELSQLVDALCSRYGVRVIEIPDSRKLRPGVCDKTLLGARGRVMHRELKSAKGRVSQAQAAEHAWMKAHGHDVDVWRPADYVSGRIEREIGLLANKGVSLGLSVGWREPLPRARAVSG